MSALPSCDHEFVETSMTRAVPTACHKCNSLCYVMQSLRKCKKANCTVYFHEKCYQEYLAEEKQKSSASSSSSSSSSPRTTSSKTCSHTFVSTTMTKMTPTVCDMCKSLCYVMQSMRKCSSCDLYYHEACFKKLVSGGVEDQNNTSSSATSAASPSSSPSIKSPASGNTINDGGHVHSLILASSSKFKMSCDVCGKVLVNFGLANIIGGTAESANKYYQCVECENFICHEACFKPQDEKIKAAILTEKEYLKKLEEYQKAHAEEKHKVITSSIGLIGALNARTRRFGAPVVNPISLYKIQKKQSSIYRALCDGLAKETLVPPPVRHWLRDVLRYAIAVYGKAYESGGFATVASNLFLQTMQKEIVYAKPEENTVAMTQVLAIPRTRVLFSFWGETVSEPTFAVIDDVADNDRVILAFRGSLTEADFLTDACAKLAPFGFCGAGAKAHEGIAQAVNRLFDKESKLFIIDRLVDIMQKQKDSTKLIVTGHSLGAGLTCLFVARAIAENSLVNNNSSSSTTRNTQDFLRGAAFAPPPTLTLPAAEKYDQYLYSVIAGKDCVPRLQLNAFDRLGLHLIKMEKEIQQEGGGAGAEEEEEEKKSAAAEAPVESQEEVHIVGKTLVTTHPTNKLQDNFCHFVERESPLLHTVWISQHMIENHTQGNYCKCLDLCNVNISEE